MKINSKTILFSMILLIANIILIYCFVPTKVDSHKIHIIVVFKSLSEGKGFWNSVSDGINVAAKEFDVETEITAPLYERDIKGQIKVINDAIEKKPDAIVLAANDYNLLVPVANKIIKSNIKLITIDSGINSNLPESLIATDNVRAGIKVGSEIASLVDKNSEIAIISHVKGSSTAIERENGVRKSLNQKGFKNIYGTLYCDNSKEKAYDITKNLMSKNSKIKGIICLNETSTLGTVMAIKEMKLNGNIKIVGFDCNVDEVKYIEQGIMQATVVQNPFNMGYRGIEIVVKSIKGQSIKKHIDTGSVLVNKANLYSPENEKLLFPFFN